MRDTHVSPHALDRLERNLRAEISWLKELHASERDADAKALELKALETAASTRQWAIGLGLVISLISLLLRFWKP